MHQMVSAGVDKSRRWWVLAIVVAAQFMFGVDAFIVNVAIPTIAAELDASPAQIESVISLYLIAYATLIVSRGRHRLHRDLAVVRPGAVGAGADRRTSGAGCDRGADGATGTGDAASVVF